MLRRATVLAVLLAAVRSAPAQIAGSASQTSAVNQTIASWYVRSLPLPSASAGVRYDFDAATGTFVRDAAPLGQLFLERADPLGKGRLNVSGSWQYLKLDSFDGVDMGALSDPVPVRLNATTAIRFHHVALDIEQQVFTGTMTYGFTDAIDASVSLPVIYSETRGAIDASIAGIDAAGVPVRGDIAGSGSEDAGNVGDLIVRAKWRFLEREAGSAALGLLVRAPTGDAGKYLGTGFWQVSPSLFVSSRRLPGPGFGRVQFHANAGVDLDAEDVGTSNASWGAGGDWNLVEPVTLGLALLGRDGFSRIAPPGFYDAPRCGPTVAACVLNGPASNRPSAPIFGLEGGRPDYIDLTFGGRALLWRDTLIGYAAVVLPVNDQGIRTEPIPLVGFEAVF
jgi:hypothetical protein